MSTYLRARTWTDVGRLPLSRRDRAAMVLALELLRRGAERHRAIAALRHAGVSGVCWEIEQAAYYAWRADFAPGAHSLLRARIALALRALLRADAGDCGAMRCDGCRCVRRREGEAALSESTRALVADRDDADAVAARLAALLTGVADALKGPPGPLKLHDWSGLPDLAAHVVRERDEARAALAAAAAPGARAMREFIAVRLSPEDAEAVRTMMTEDALEEAEAFGAQLDEASSRRTSETAPGADP